ncbi:MAG TPA: hypothetical protein H9758_02930 [Candidatus Mediterraneibacter faecipullorum]|uniref:Uncharacterized protein n=1 Tax=Candidatus Mediterraneibacter faecipullorum TaxID=2838670 RepID=A0A9D2NJU8_9FIRM|nr:hypothetical protein [Candidatus Mediterraneibacter faecipullorum]
MTKTDIVKYEGGQYVTVDAPIDRIPLFVREGSILPMIEQIMYADAADGMKLKLNVYTGKERSFSYQEQERRIIWQERSWGQRFPAG